MPIFVTRAQWLTALIFTLASPWVSAKEPNIDLSKVRTDTIVTSVLNAVRSGQTGVPVGRLLEKPIDTTRIKGSDVFEARTQPPAIVASPDDEMVSIVELLRVMNGRSLGSRLHLVHELLNRAEDLHISVFMEMDPQLLMSETSLAAVADFLAQSANLDRKDIDGVRSGLRRYLMESLVRLRPRAIVLLRVLTDATQRPPVTKDHVAWLRELTRDFVDVEQDRLQEMGMEASEFNGKLSGILDRAAQSGLVDCKDILSVEREPAGPF